ncbi:MAG: ATP/maltotriose-dependent transcriptional regulator MalT [Arenicella sp.]|jgi:ATP/maltotriose-dependent transcriptional regulator MalT
MKWILLLSILFPSQVFSQNEEMLTLKNAVDTLFFSDKTTALNLSNKGLQIAIAEKDTFHITYFLDQSGELNRFAGNYDLAIEQLSYCLLMKDGWEDLKDLSLTFNNLGKTYAQKGKYEEAVFNFLEALELMQTDENLMGQAFYLNNIGAVYDLQHNYFKALEYYEQSLAIKEEQKDTLGIAASCINLGITFHNLERYEKSILYSKRAFSIFSKSDTPTRTARSLANIGNSYLELDDYVNANYYLTLAIALEPNIEEESLIISLNNNLATLHLNIENGDSASYYNNKSYDLSRNSNSLKGLANASRVQSQIYELLGDDQKALEEERLYTKYNDSLINEANIYAVAEMESKYNLAQQEKKIQQKNFELQKQKLQREKDATLKKFYLSLTITLIVIFILILVKYRQKRRVNSLLTTQNNLITDKNQNLERIKETLKSALHDKTEILDKVFTSNKSLELPPEMLSLSKREMEVLASLALGKSDQEIADSLFVSKATTKTHLRRIYSKLLVKGRSEAVAVAHKYKILGDSNTRDQSLV